MKTHSLPVVWHLFLQSSRLQKKRATLTIASIAWGTVSILLLLAFGEGLKNQLLANEQGMGRNISIFWSNQTTKAYRGLPPGRRLKFRLDDAEYLQERMGGMGTVIGEIQNGRIPLAYGKRTVNGSIVGCESPYRIWRNQVPQMGGRFFDVTDEKEKRRVIFLGDKVAKDIFDKEDPVGKSLLVNNMPFLVIGILKHRTQDDSYMNQDENQTFIPRTTFQTMFSDKYLDDIVLGVTDPLQMKSAVARLRQIMAARMGYDPTDEHALQVWNTVDDNKETAQIFLGIQMFLGIIGALTLVIGGVGVANIMYAVVRERTREIGVKMALGARPAWITAPFVLEASLYTLLGGLTGTLIAIGLVRLLGLIPLDSEVMAYLGHPTLNVPIGAVTTVILGLIGLAAGYFPARRAATIDPATTLRYE